MKPMARLRSSVLVSAIALLVLATRVQGQNRTLSAKECDKLAKIVEKGHPEKKEPDALSKLSACGAIGAQALADGMSQYRFESDTAAVALFMRSADEWRDAAIMDATTRLATDPAATVQVRVYAVRYLTGLVNPYFVLDYKAIISGMEEVRDEKGVVISWSLGCPRVMRSWAPNRVGTPLPADYRSRIRGTLDGLAAQSALPLLVRNALQCVDFNVSQ